MKTGRIKPHEYWSYTYDEIFAIIEGYYEEKEWWDYRFAMVCLTNQTTLKKKKEVSVFDYFNLPEIEKRQKEETEKDQLNTLAMMFNQGYRNPLKKENKKPYKRALKLGLIDEEKVNKFISEKWQTK